MKKSAGIGLAIAGLLLAGGLAFAGKKSKTVIFLKAGKTYKLKGSVIGFSENLTDNDIATLLFGNSENTVKSYQIFRKGPNKADWAAISTQTHDFELELNKPVVTVGRIEVTVFSVMGEYQKATI